jgi:hypothetical protein
MSESWSPSVRNVSSTRQEPPIRASSRFADSLSERTSIACRSEPVSLPRAGFPGSARSAATAIASLSVEAAGKRARAFHAAP